MSKTGLVPNDYLGVYSEPLSIGIHDPYTKKTTERSSFRGKQLIVNGPKVGQLPEAYLDKTIQLYSTGEPHKDPVERERMIRKKAGEYAPTGKPFKPSSAIKTTTTKGHPEVALGIVPLDEVSVNYHPGRRNAKVEREKKNLYTSPAHQGMAGYPMQTRNIGGQAYPYIADTYEGARALERALRKADKIEKPFRGGGGDRTLTDTFAAPSKFLNAEGGFGPRRREKVPVAPKPFKSPGPPRSGQNDDTLLSKIGHDHYPTPPIPTKFRSRESTGAPVFKPAGHQLVRLSGMAVPDLSIAARPPRDTAFTAL